MSDIDEIRARHEANARHTVGVGSRRMSADIATLLDYVAALEVRLDTAHAATQEARDVLMVAVVDFIRAQAKAVDDATAAQKAENAQLREAATAYINIATFPAWGTGNCRLCVERDGVHASDCEYDKAEIALWAAIKKGGTR